SHPRRRTSRRGTRIDRRPGAPLAGLADDCPRRVAGTRHRRPPGTSRRGVGITPVTCDTTLPPPEFFYAQTVPPRVDHFSCYSARANARATGKLRRFRLRPLA